MYFTYIYRERYRERERDRESERERGTTLESHDCPVWCAAPTGSRLPNQAPAAPQSFDPGGGGPTEIERDRER